MYVLRFPIENMKNTFTLCNVNRNRSKTYHDLLIKKCSSVFPRKFLNKILLHVIQITLFCCLIIIMDST